MERKDCVWEREGTLRRLWALLAAANGTRVNRVGEYL